MDSGSKVGLYLKRARESVSPARESWRLWFVELTDLAEAEASLLQCRGSEEMVKASVSI